MTDVIIVGGGVIGLTTAYELAGQGMAVTVLDQGPIGREASWAGAGILPPGNRDGATDPQVRLRAESHVRWPDLSRELREQTGIDNGFWNCGGIGVALPGSIERIHEEITAWRTEGVQVEELTSDRLSKYEPALNQGIETGFRLPELCQIRNPRHLKALAAGCAARGVELLPGTPVIGFDRQAAKVVAVRTNAETYAAGQFCVTSGAWSQQLLAESGCQVRVEPVRGQIVLLSVELPPFRHVIQVGPRYLVPRPDGRILVGSTEEWAGFNKNNTAEAVAGLTRFAIEVLPCLTQARFEQAWAGLRPRSGDGLPYLGRVPGTDNLYVATGHFRSGLQMSPATAVLMRQLVLGQEPLIPLEAFSLNRHSGET